MATSTDEILAQIDVTLNAYERGRSSSKYEDMSDLGDAYTSEMITRLAATIDRLSPAASQYRENAKAALKQYGPSNPYNIAILAGVELTHFRGEVASWDLRACQEFCV